MSGQILSNHKFLSVLILLLLLALGVQAGFIYKMKKQLCLIDQQQSNLQQQVPPQTQDTRVTKNIIPEADDNLTAQNTADEQPRPLQKNKQQAIQQQDQDQNSTINDVYTGNRAPTWGPYAEIEHMRRDRDRMLSQHFRPYYAPHDFQRHFRLSTSSPEIDVKENEHQYMVSVNLPGANENDISVNLDGQRLTIRGKHHYEKQGSDPGGNFIIKERQSGRFQRSISLTHPVQQNKMKTRLDNGILKILIPKITDRQWR